MTRPTLRDRKNAARAHDNSPDVEAPSQPGEAPHVEPEQAQETPKTLTEPKTTPAAKAASTATATTATARLGIYLTPEEFADAKSAYLTDWKHGGQADTFARWIGAALATHAARTPKKRADTGQLKGRAETRTGSARSFSIPADNIERMREGISADQQADRWLSDSAWAGEAIARAVEAARATNGGTLPVPPPRLPNRLVR